MNDTVVLDTTKIHHPVAVPSGAMYLYLQLVPGPDGAVPAPGADTPSQVVVYVDWVKYHR